MRIVDNCVVGHIVNLINALFGSRASDRTVFFFCNGSVDNTTPATPNELRGDKIFRLLREFPPHKNFSGRMIVDRQGGEIKNIIFE